MTLEKQVHDLEVRVSKLEREKKDLLLRIQNLESKINMVTGVYGDNTSTHKKL